jgi:Mg-chelatase subunit ChlD
MTPVPKPARRTIFENIKDAPCIGVKSVVTTIDDTTVVGEAAGCSDPEYAALAGEALCSNAPSIERLIVGPTSGHTIAAVTGRASYSAKLEFKYKDGTIRKKDVTKEASWDSVNRSVAKWAGAERGVFMGLFNPDTPTSTTSIIATYTPSAPVNGENRTRVKGNKLEGSAPITVQHRCVDNAIDIVLVVDRSGSMRKVDDADGGISRIEGAKAACRALIENAKMAEPKGNPSKDSNPAEETVTSPANPRGEFDRIGIISYAGKSGEKAVHRHSDKFLLTKSEALAVVDEIEISSDCEGPSKRLKGCYTGMGGGLDEAYNLLKEDYRGATPRTNYPRKVIVLLTDGHENVCAPDPEVIAAKIVADRIGSSTESNACNTMIAVVGFTLDSTATVKRCNGASVTVDVFLKALGNCYGNSTSSALSLVFYPQNIDDLKVTFTDAMRKICEDNEQTGTGTDTDTPCEYLAITNMYKGHAKELLDKFSFDGFKKWFVCKNTVDLMGTHVFKTVQPGLGTYVGLIGNRGTKQLSDLKQANLFSDFGKEAKTCQRMFAPYDHNFGGIETKTKYHLSSLTEYRLVVKAAGNITQGAGQFKHGVELGSSIRITVGGKQEGTLEISKAYPDGRVARYIDEEGTIEDGRVDNIPRLVTREIVGALFEVVEPIGPSSAAFDYSYTFWGNNKENAIRIEQFPADYSDEANYATSTTDHMFANAAARDAIFDGKGCAVIKGDPEGDEESPLLVSDFSGFVAEGNAAGGRVAVSADNAHLYEYQTSGADAELSNVPFGVNIIEVTLQSGKTVDGVFIPNTIAAADHILFDDFEDAGGVVAP